MISRTIATLVAIVIAADIADRVSIATLTRFTRDVPLLIASLIRALLTTVSSILCMPLMASSSLKIVSTPNCTPQLVIP